MLDRFDRVKISVALDLLMITAVEISEKKKVTSEAAQRRLMLYLDTNYICQVGLLFMHKYIGNRLWKRRLMFIKKDEF